MVSVLFLCENITMNTGILFNLWGFCPDYKSASDGIMLDMLLESMEERENGIFDQSGVKSAPAQNVNWIQVSGIEGAKNQIVQQGHTAWMMDNNAPYFYVKSVDNVGSCTFRIFQFTEVQEIAQEPQEQPQIDLSGYVQRSEFEQLKAMIEQLTNAQEKQPVKENKEVVSSGESVNGNDGKTGAGRNAGRK